MIVRTKIAQRIMILTFATGMLAMNPVSAFADGSQTTTNLTVADKGQVKVGLGSKGQVSVGSKSGVQVSGQASVSLGGKTSTNHSAGSNSSTTSQPKMGSKTGLKTGSKTTLNGHVDAQGTQAKTKIANPTKSTVHTRIHMQVQGNSDVGKGSSGATQVQSDVVAHIHDKVELAAAHLELALQNLGCTQSDYLYAYLQSSHLGTREVNQAESNLQLMTKLVGQYRLNGQWGLAERQEALRLLLSSATALHLGVVFTDAIGNTVDVLKSSGSETITLHLNNSSGQLAGSIQTTGASVLSPNHVQNEIQQLALAASSAKTLSDTGKFVGAPVIRLPKTASTDPLWMLVGGLLMILGASAFVLRRRISGWR